MENSYNNQNNQNNNESNNGNGPMGMPPVNNNTVPAQAPAQTNTMAILSLVFVFIFSPLSLVFGLIALSQIKKTGEGGKGLAIAGTVLGSLGLVFILIFVVLAIIGAIVGQSSPSYSTY